MNRLTAKYEITMSHGFWIKFKRGECPSVSTVIDGYSVAITLLTDTCGIEIRSGKERLMSKQYAVIGISVSHDETEAPPVVRNAVGGIDYSAQVPYFAARTGNYAKIAAEAVNRLLMFFRYRLHQPIENAISPYHQVFRNPRWVDENDTDVGHGVNDIAINMQYPTRLGMIPFQKKHQERLSAAITRKRIPKLYEEFLSDAEASAHDGNLRRAILGLAIACEVAVKRKFFGSSSGGRTLEYLEDQRNIDVRVIDLINKAAAEVFGESFKDLDEAAYTNLDYLFRCRNKIAHRGQAVFRDHQRVLHTATVANVSQWLESARKLFVWLRKLSHK